MPFGDKQWLENYALSGQTFRRQGKKEIPASTLSPTVRQQDIYQYFKNKADEENYNRAYANSFIGARGGNWINDVTQQSLLNNKIANTNLLMARDPRIASRLMFGEPVSKGIDYWLGLKRQTENANSPAASKKTPYKRSTSITSLAQAEPSIVDQVASLAASNPRYLGASTISTLGMSEGKVLGGAEGAKKSVDLFSRLIPNNQPVWGKPDPGNFTGGYPFTTPEAEKQFQDSLTTKQKQEYYIRDMQVYNDTNAGISDAYIEAAIPRGISDYIFSAMDIAPSPAKFLKVGSLLGKTALKGTAPVARQVGRAAETAGQIIKERPRTAIAGTIAAGGIGYSVSNPDQADALTAEQFTSLVKRGLDAPAVRAGRKLATTEAGNAFSAMRNRGGGVRIPIREMLTRPTAEYIVDIARKTPDLVKDNSEYIKAYRTSKQGMSQPSHEFVKAHPVGMDPSEAWKTSPDHYISQPLNELEKQINNLRRSQGLPAYTNYRDIIKEGIRLANEGRFGKNTWSAGLKGRTLTDARNYMGANGVLYW